MLSTVGFGKSDWENGIIGGHGDNENEAVDKTNKTDSDLRDQLA